MFDIRTTMHNFALIYTVTVTALFLQGNSFLLPLSTMFPCMHQKYLLQNNSNWD